jgi:hypothetical protein
MILANPGMSRLMQYTARPALCLCILASLCVFVARGIEEKMGLTFAYMPPRTYTRLAEYVQQFLLRDDRRPDVLLQSGQTRRSFTCRP